ncbi:hypothetical protein FN846DRAFT_955956 [Sphaerosporella brunnea]|uniref:Uncharacterized protein n=1 Tax=Sphaerosporella brunnea TaxID=1250544 RepID=A0A5J5ESG4_9PEZI|nr:hypothetical protein FN846DRAFT_955956 [Sphaerosporella brunnea]
MGSPRSNDNLVQGQRFLSWSASRQALICVQLETDPDILLYKCRQALERYRHHFVVGNLLPARKFEVVFCG